MPAKFQCEKTKLDFILRVNAKTLDVTNTQSINDTCKTFLSVVKCDENRLTVSIIWDGFLYEKFKNSL